MTEQSLAYFIPDIPANPKFKCIKDILVNGDFGVNFFMVNEMTESYFYTYTKIFTVLELLIQVSSMTWKA